MHLSNARELFAQEYHFKELNEVTKTQYINYLNEVIAYSQDKHIAYLESREFMINIRKFIKTVHDTYPIKAKIMQCVFKALVKWCYCEGYTQINLSELLTFRTRQSSMLSNVWTETDIIHISQKSSQAMQDYIFMALETGLRRCDLIKLKYTDIQTSDGGIQYFIIKPQKTHHRFDNPIYLPLTRKLQEWLAQRQKTSSYILTSARGNPWNKSSFISQWKRLIKRENIKGLTPHGLRKTSVTRLAKAGCTVLEIASLIGWSVRCVNKMLDKHYFSDKLAVAVNAVEKLNGTR